MVLLMLEKCYANYRAGIGKHKACGLNVTSGTHLSGLSQHDNWALHMLNMNKVCTFSKIAPVYVVCPLENELLC